MTIAEATHIRTDKETLAKLREKAGGKPISAFLRDLANGVEQVPVPANALVLLQKSIFERLDAISEDIRFLKEQDYFTSMNAVGSQGQIQEIQSAIVGLAALVPGGKDYLKNFEDLNDIQEEQEYYKTHHPLDGIDGIMEPEEAIEKMQKEYNLSDAEVEDLRKEFEDDESESDEQ